MLRVGIVAGEHSGDTLGAGLMRELRARRPDVRFVGIGGPQMAAEGCEVLFPMEKLSLIGLVEVLEHLPEVLGIRRTLQKRFLDERPDVYIGIDCPDFNLGLEERLRAAGIRTVHYVSPTVWAWRRYRVRQIARAVDLMLSVFPFEEAFYREHGVPVRFVGHPLADLLPLEPDRGAARERVGLPAEAEIVALLPGSRTSELRKLAAPFLGAARHCAERRPGIVFAAPMASRSTREQFEEAFERIGRGIDLRIVDGRARDVMTAADVVLAASGTATLEALLCKRPVVVSYRVKKVSWWLMRRLLHVRHYSLPNLLAGREVVRELMQADATPGKLGAAVLRYLERPEEAVELQQVFRDIHETLRRDASSGAAEAVLEMLEAPAAGAA